MQSRTGTVTDLCHWLHGGLSPLMMSSLGLSGLWQFLCLVVSIFLLCDLFCSSTFPPIGSRVFVACAVADAVSAVNVVGTDMGKHSKKLMA